MRRKAYTCGRPPIEENGDFYTVEKKRRSEEKEKAIHGKRWQSQVHRGIGDRSLLQSTGA
jgi:hypothetical protein